MVYQTPVLLNQSALASTTLNPVTFTNTITSTTAGTTLVALVALACSGAPAITTPANWTQLGTLTVAGTAIAATAYAYPNNPGGITSVVWTTLTNVNAIATSVTEWQGMPLALNFDPGGVIQNVYGTAVTAPAVVARTPVLGNVLWIGFLAALTGLSLTAALIPASGNGQFIALTGATSTTGTTNVVIQPYYSLPGATYPGGAGNKVQIAGTTTSGAAGATMIGLGSLAASSLMTIGTSPYGGQATGQGVGEGVGL